MTNPIEQDGPTKMREGAQPHELEKCTGPFTDARDCPVHRPSLHQPTPARMPEGEDRTVRVPREPTEAMLRAGYDAYQQARVGTRIETVCELIYRAMLSAVEKK